MSTMSKRKFLGAVLAGAMMLTNSSLVLAQAPVEKSANGIQYLSGGIGIEEIEAMRSVSKQYNLLMQFQIKGSGSFITDVDVTVLNNRGKEIFSTKSEGPCLFVNLPAGTYKVKANFSEKTLTKTRSVRKGHRTEMYFYWPLKENDDAADRMQEAKVEAPHHPDCT